MQPGGPVRPESAKPLAGLILGVKLRFQGSLLGLVWLKCGLVMIFYVAQVVLREDQADRG